MTGDGLSACAPITPAFLVILGSSFPREQSFAIPQRACLVGSESLPSPLPWSSFSMSFGRPWVASRRRFLTPRLCFFGSRTFVGAELEKFGRRAQLSFLDVFFFCRRQKMRYPPLRVSCSHGFPGNFYGGRFDARLSFFFTPPSKFLGLIVCCHMSHGRQTARFAKVASRRGGSVFSGFKDRVRFSLCFRSSA